MFRWIAALIWIALASPLAAQSDWRDDVIYFVMLDRFADGDPANNAGVDLSDPLAFHGGDLVGLTRRLDYIADLGATAIWLTPVTLQVPPIDHEGRPFSGHHGYWAEDMAALDPRYGTEADLRALTDAAHARGLKVILDVVYNHMGYGATMTAQRPDWLRQGSDCGGDDITLCLAGLPDLRTDRADVRAYLFDAHIGLAERTGIDGFRLDTFKHVEPDFWAAHRAETRRRLGDDFFLLGEIWDGDKYAARTPFADDTVDAIFDFSFRTNTLNFLLSINNTARYARQFSGRHDAPAGHTLAPFLSNHDMPTLLAMLRGDTDKLRLAFALLMFAEGPPVIAWGEELGRQGGPWPDNREDMDWTATDSPIASDLRTLIALRHAEPSMRMGSVETLSDAGDLLMLRRDNAILIVNRGTTDATLPTLPDGSWTVAAGRASLGAEPTIPPLGYAILLGSGG